MNGQTPTVQLYCNDSNARLRSWTISGKDFVIHTTHGLVNGAQISNTEHVTEGKAGRTRHEQMMLQILSDIRSKRDKGYVEDINVAKTERRTNAAGLLRPMLALPLEKRSFKDSFKGAFWSRKLNGHRCLITKQNDKFITYSRNGKPINLPHLYEGLALRNGETLDGELYIHGTPLRTLSSLIRAPKVGSTELKLHVYDYISSLSFNERYHVLKMRFNNVPNLVICEQIEITENVDMHDLTAKAVADGYEGGIIRLAGTPYLDGKKTNKMLKLKSFLDDEFLVVDIKPSKDGWAVLTCVTAEGKEFGCSAPGNRQAQYKTMEQRHNYIGRSVQIKYFELTTDGIPFHPVPTKEGWVDRGELG